MNSSEIKEMLRSVPVGAEEKYSSRAASLDKTAANEKKALMIARQMAKQCSAFVTMGASEDFAETRVFVQKHYFDAYREKYASLSAEDKKSFIIFAFAVTMVRCSFLDEREAQAKASSAAEGFENKVVTGVLREILDEWQKLWNTYGCMKCEVYKNE